MRSAARHKKAHFASATYSFSVYSGIEKGFISVRTMVAGTSALVLKAVVLMMRSSVSE
jgi:hypothetical protein